VLRESGAPLLVSSPRLYETLRILSLRGGGVVSRLESDTLSSTGYQRTDIAVATVSVSAPSDVWVRVPMYASLAPMRRVMG
jgi:hypothetical protein